MAMGTRKGRERQEDLWVAYADMATGPGHPFYVRLNEVLDGEGFDAFVEEQCARFYADKLGRPGLTPHLLGIEPCAQLLHECPSPSSTSLRRT
jgi:transposase